MEQLKQIVYGFHVRYIKRDDVMQIVQPKQLQQIDLPVDRALAMININFAKTKQLLGVINDFGKQFGATKMSPLDLYYLNPSDRSGARARVLIGQFGNELHAAEESSRRIAMSIADPNVREAVKARIDSNIANLKEWGPLLEMNQGQRDEYIKSCDAENSSVDNWFKSVYIADQEPAQPMAM